ncbi:MAG TPA: gamma-glutamylcyclotransferase [Ktedonobacteraceae bacterium]|nr:gamma-glutamylcyclotransferase [Ktedonobacteraceae bacterium]
MEERYDINKEQPVEENPDTSGESAYVAPGIPIVRANTPRPMPFSLRADKTDLPLAPSRAAADFPTQAPDAPPLPEEQERGAAASIVQEAPATPRPATEAASGSLPGEFIWLFEYALDMDPMFLNRPERLDGSAFAYGPAVLSGYCLAFDGLDTRTGHVLASLREAPDQPEAEVWGILYRVPRRFTQSEDGRVSLLDRVHHATSFVPVEIQVREAYRQREITCLTYIASQTGREQIYQLAQEERLPDLAYVKRLLQVARRQKLPASYLRILEELVPTDIPAATPLPTTPPEQNTEPLVAVVPGHELRSQASYSEEMVLRPEIQMASMPGSLEAVYPAYLRRWMMTFALYVCLLLLVTLLLAIFQGLGFGEQVFTNAFAPLGVPWYVLLYGLLGGCVSCVFSLSRPLFVYPPTFVVLTWFIRPFLGAVFGAFAYLILTSGIILLSTQPAQHFALCSIIGTLAGLCEGRILLGKRHRQASA